MLKAPIHVSKIHNSAPDFHAPSPLTHPWNIHVASPKSWTLRAAQIPGGFFKSETLAKFSFWGNLAYNKILPIFMFFIKFSNFHVDGPNLESTQTFDRKFFGSSYLHHLGLDKRKTQTNDRRSSTHQKCKIFQPKKSAQDSTNLAPTTIEKYCFTSLV